MDSRVYYSVAVLRPSDFNLTRSNNIEKVWKEVALTKKKLYPLLANLPGFSFSDDEIGMTFLFALINLL
jgi:hypothetical protein